MRVLSLCFFSAFLLTLSACSKPQAKGEVERIPAGKQQHYKDYYQTPPLE